MRSCWRILALLLLSLLGPAAASAAEPLHTFWEVTGRSNKVWLLGSVHLLHSTDSALPPVVNAAFMDAETIVEELDLFAATAEIMGGSGLSRLMLPQGQTLAAVLGSELYARLQQRARPLGIDLDFMSRMQPWFVAMQIQQVQLLRAGFSPFYGVDYQIAEQARRANKPLIGLETANEQLSLFANLSLEEQREFLRATLDENDVGTELRDITAAWRGGDVAALNELLRKGAQESPVFFKSITTDRNLRWLPEIESMLLDASKDYLVVTGALHMVGDDGLVSLLRKKGYRVEQK